MIKQALILNLVCYYYYSSATLHTTFCMVTSERPVSYLDRVLETFKTEHIHQMDGVGLMVVKVDGFNYFQNFKRKIAVCNTKDKEGLPICKVRQSTLDVTESLLLCANHTSQWVVLVEDDCEACPGAIVKIVETLGKLNSTTTAIAKFSKFSRGVAFPVAKIGAYAQHAQLNIYKKPYDIFQVKEWDPIGAAVYTHPVNLFHHIGLVSTINYRNEKDYHKAYDKMRSDYCGEPLLN